jgi:hypothetical protein
MSRKRVYFMKPVGMDGPIKVGCSKMPESRLKSVSLWSPFPLELITSAPGDHCHENALHHLLRAHQSNGEWFHANETLAAIIQIVQDTGELPSIDTRRDRERGGALPRPGFTAVSRAKSKLTQSITAAERHAYGYETANKRPAHIVAIYNAYHDPAAPFPVGGALAAVEEYVATLRAMPKADRSFAAWQAWKGYDLSVAPRATAKPSSAAAA